jgi:L-aspartate semialdehyde sulfurtransferase
MKKSICEIQEKIKSRKAVVLTATEFKTLAEKFDKEELVRKVDVVTTATFGPMCSSGVMLNLGHSSPPMRYETITLNDVSAYGGLAAADVYIGATEESPANHQYGGAHVIEDLLRGNKIKVKASSKGTDCYPRKHIEAEISLQSINEAIMFNPRNAYQNYAAATNSSDKTQYTYMGVLLPENRNITFSTSGEMSPLLNDPFLRSIGIGSRIFLGGTQGYVVWNGTQHFTGRERNMSGIPLGPSATLAVIGDLKEMDPQFIRAAYYEKYGTSLFVGLGVPFAVTDTDVAEALSVRNNQIETLLFDYGSPERPVIGKFNYAQLLSGNVILNGKTIPTAPLSSLKTASNICEILRDSLMAGEFEITSPVALLPQVHSVNKLKTQNL